ncbi:hypothetical protein GG344DRAFT_66844 [Lentinula edodes]|nr:hypothetical protein GG344DRAFT_66844 [Lentinula edodes]
MEKGNGQLITKITSETGVVTSICQVWSDSSTLVSTQCEQLPMACILCNSFKSLNSRMRFHDMQTTLVTEMVTIPFPGTTAQPSELQMDLPAITSAPSESKIEEGPQFEVKALPLSLA